ARRISATYCQYRRRTALRLLFVVATPPARAARARDRSRCLVHLAALVALAEGGALVVQLLAASQAELDLGAPVLEVEPERDERQPALGDLAGQPADLLPVQQLPVITVEFVGVGGAAAVMNDV